MIYIDASRYTNTEFRTGVENYSHFLINELIKLHKNEITLISPKKINLNIKQITIPFPRLWTLARLSWEIWRNKKINNLFIPSHVLPLIYPKRTTITIHDVVFKYSPKSYSFASRMYLNWAAKFAIKHAKNIVVPSEATKNDLIKFYKANSKKIHVIPNGFSPQKITVSKKEEDEIISKFKLKKRKYFLYVGRIEHKKNTDTLIKAFEKFTKQDYEITLVLVGFPGHGGKEIIQNIPKHIKKRIILTGYVSDLEKEALLKNCICFIFPSRFEGFGIPLLEAMHANVPIIASNISTSKEIAKDVALFFEKENSVELSKLMQKITNNKKLRSEYKQNYDKILKKHTWNLHANKVYNLITK